jgi:hypothetical protein
MANKETPAKKAKNAEYDSSLVCTSIQRIAHDNEEVVLENADVRVTFQYKNSVLHDQYVKGESYDLEY